MHIKMSVLNAVLRLETLYISLIFALCHYFDPHLDVIGHFFITPPQDIYRNTICTT